MLYLVKKKNFYSFDIIHKTEGMEYNAYRANEQYHRSIKAALKSFNNFDEEFNFIEDTFEQFLNKYDVLAEAEDSFDIKDLEELYPEYFL